MNPVRLTDGVDAGGIWHYGDPMAEQRALAAGAAAVDLSHRPTFAVSGPDRLSWLNAICSQDLAGLPPGRAVSTFILDAQGRISHAFAGVDDGTTFSGHTEPGRLPALLEWLTRMVFAARVEIADTTGAVVAVRPAGSTGEILVEKDAAGEVLGEAVAGLWASEALRIAAGVPRAFLDTDDLAIPNELANPDGDALGEAVHLAKGCYPGQETVSRVYNLGRPPRRLVLLQLDGSTGELPSLGASVELGGRSVGRMGTSQRHHELGPIGLALLKRQTPADAPLVVSGIDALAEVIVAPDAGLHWRPEPGLGRR